MYISELCVDVKCVCLCIFLCVCVFCVWIYVFLHVFVPTYVCSSMGVLTCKCISLHLSVHVCVLVCV